MLETSTVPGPRKVSILPSLLPCLLMKLVTHLMESGEEEMKYTYKVSYLPRGEKSEHLNTNTHPPTDALENQDEGNHEGVKNCSGMDEVHCFHQGAEWQLGQICKLASAQGLKEIGSGPETGL